MEHRKSRRIVQSRLKRRDQEYDQCPRQRLLVEKEYLKPPSSHQHHHHLPTAVSRNPNVINRMFDKNPKKLVLTRTSEATTAVTPKPTTNSLFVKIPGSTFSPKPIRISVEKLSLKSRYPFVVVMREESAKLEINFQGRKKGPPTTHTKEEISNVCAHQTRPERSNVLGSLLAVHWLASRTCCYVLGRRGWDLV